MQYFLKNRCFPLVALVFAAAFFCLAMPNVSGKQKPPVSIDQVLNNSWAFYKSRFMANGERVVSEYYGGTISEGQSYALLKAVWMGEPETFERVWHWTKQAMRRPDDHLIGWRWGEREDGSWGLLETDNAADADQDIAYALLLAGERWGRLNYIEDARAIIHDLWRLNVEKIDGRYYLSPGTWEGFRRNGILTVNPSYFAPYVYRKFAEYDTRRAAQWTKLARDTYDTLAACSALTRTGLPPNWCGIPYHANDHRVAFSDVQGEGARDFGYDAVRVFWRMAMDARLAPEPANSRAKTYLKNHPYLIGYWQTHQRLPEGFSASGEALGPENSGFGLASGLAQRGVLTPGNLSALYSEMLAPHYRPEGYWFNDYNDYLHSVIWLHLYTLTPDKYQTASD